GGIVPLALLASKALRRQPALLSTGALLVALGIAFNRLNVVLLAQHLNGPMPYAGPEVYTPSLVEWGISIGLIAATIFLFGPAAGLVPLLPKEETEQVRVVLA